MNESLKEKLLSMLPGMDEKKLSAAMDTAIEMLKNNNVNDAINSMTNNSTSEETATSSNSDMLEMIKNLSDSKKTALWEKFNSSEVQEALKSNPNKALEMLKQSMQE